MTQVYTDLYQFTDVIKPIMLSMHQYLLLSQEPVLIQTGAIQQAQANLLQLKKLLGARALKYVLISHFESDECGGLSTVLNDYPNAVAVCSEVTARQLMGFGITDHVLVKKPGELLSGNSFEFMAIGYPSEMHLWEGLLFMETERGIFFSSDLMFQMGETQGQVTESTWPDAVRGSGASQLPSPDMQKKLLEDLDALRPLFVASGHGPCMKIIW